MDGFRKGKGGISRRRLLETTGKVGAAGAVGSSSLLSGCLEDVVGGGGLKIGMLAPYSFVARWGRVSTWSLLSGIMSVYDEDPIPFEPDGLWAGSEAVLEPEDRRYEVLIRDTSLDPSIAVSAAEVLVLDENVDILFGGIDSSTCIRVIEQVAKPTDTPYIAGGSSTEIAADPDLCGRNLFRTNEHVGMEARAIGTYVGDETDTETMYLYGAENSFGRSVLREYRKSLESKGVEVVGERTVPSDFSEHRDILAEIDDQAEAVGIGFSARTLESFLTALIDGNATGAFELRVHGPLPGLISMGVMANSLQASFDEITEENIQEANIGGLASRYHWNQYDNPINDGFVSNFEETYGTLPTLFAGGAFTAGSAVAQAVEETGSTNGDDIAEAMYGMTVEKTPKGENGYAFQERNNQAKSEMTIANLVPNEEENWGAEIMPSEPIARISAEDATLPEDDPDMECDLTAR